MGCTDSRGRNQRLVTADILLKGGCRRIAILDEYRHVGGNHLDRHISGYTFDLGSLIFFDNSPFFEHFPEIKNLYTVVDVPLGRLTPLGDISIYPISLKKDVLAKGPLEITRMVLSLAYARVFRSNPRSLGEAHHLVAGHCGKSFASAPTLLNSI